MLSDSLLGIFEESKDKRIVVVGTTCTGKSALIKHIPNARDMDDIVFPQPTKEEADYVMQKSWTPEIGETMARLVREKVKIKPGEPVFRTVIIDADLIVYLHIDDALLKKRVGERGVSFADAKSMQDMIKQEIDESGIPCITIEI
ncbi:MAG: hypothetical protein J4432_02965 [DPANN group archaeon]|nr:hypothetical protein [DPANN group archaeon]